MPKPPAQAADRALAVLEVHCANLTFQPGVMGAGIGLSGRADGEEGIPVTVILTDQFIAFQAELGHGSGDSWPNLNFSIYDLGHVV